MLLPPRDLPLRGSRVVPLPPGGRHRPAEAATGTQMVVGRKTKGQVKPVLFVWGE